MHIEETCSGADLLQVVKSLHHRCFVIRENFIRWNEEKPIEGLHRYLQTLDAETQFLERMLDDPSTILPKYTESTNVHHLEAFHQAMATVRAERIMQVIDVPPLRSGQWLSKADRLKLQSIKVDMITANGAVWIKVIARNAKALRHEMAGLELSDDEEGADTFLDALPIIEKAREYLRTAEAHHVHFKVPKVIFAFMRIQSNEDIFVQKMIMDRLTAMGIHVHMQDMTWIPMIGKAPKVDMTTDKLNLDVSTAMVLLSELAHHPCTRDQIEGEALKAQAEREAIEPVLPVLQRRMENKELYMVQTAFDRLEKIVSIVGGPKEKRRFEYLFRKDLHSSPAFDHALWTQLPSLHIRVIPDAHSPLFEQLLQTQGQTGKKKKVNNGRKIRTGYNELHAIIFGSGHHYKMTTFTGIQWMRTALEDAGILGTAIVSHEPRSLAEEKMHSEKTVFILDS